MPNLLFVMTPGVNLSAWKDSGSFSREIKPYLEYAAHGFKVRILSFGTERFDFSNLHENLKVITVKCGLIHAHLLPFTHAAHFKWADVIKTNQSYLSWIFVFAAEICKKPILLRCGFVRGEYMKGTNAPWLKTRVYQFLEGFAFRNATRVHVPTEKLARWIISTYNVISSKIFVVPNFVDVDLFRPSAKIEKKEKSIISIGRLHPVKRFDLLLRACALIGGIVVTIVGEGEERDKLSNLAKDLKVELNLPGNIPNDKLPDVLREHNVFVITSLVEGHPKALIEAMACGLPCLGTFSGQEAFSGVFVATSKEPEAISAAIVQLFADNVRSTKYSILGRDFVQINYAFPHVFAIERASLLELSR